MSRTIYLSAEDFTKLWEDHKSKLCIGVFQGDPSLANYTVQGYSGPGTPFANEYERMKHEHYNPAPPHTITVVEGDGMIDYKPEKCRNMLAIEIIMTELRKKNSGHHGYNPTQHARDIWNAIKDLV